MSLIAWAWIWAALAIATALFGGSDTGAFSALIIAVIFVVGDRIETAIRETNQ